jgi:hypothetical protein
MCSCVFPPGGLTHLLKIATRPRNGGSLEIRICHRLFNSHFEGSCAGVCTITTCGDPMDYVFTLLHGTHARHARWVQPDSMLCQQLAREVSPAQTAFRKFDWSGANSPFGRRRAALQLQEYLSEGLSKYPDARHIIIAHSHGGNVAAMSLEDDALRRKIFALVCLSTPFLVARHRPFGSWLEGMLAVGLAFAMLAALPGSVALSVLSGVALGGLLVARLKSLPGRLIKAVTIGDLSGLNLLIVRSAADETTPLLALGHLTGWASTRLYAAPSHLVRLALLTPKDGSEARHRAISRLALLVVTPVLVFALSTMFREIATDLLRAIALPVAIGALISGSDLPDPETAVSILAALMAVSVLFGVTVVIGLGVMTSAVAVGWAGAMCGVTVEVSPEAAPPGQWLIRQMPFSSSAPMSPFSLQHSTIYEDPRAIRAIGKWALTTVGRSLEGESDVEHSPTP